MTYNECCNLVDRMNKLFSGWYSWSTAKPWTWEKIILVLKKYDPQTNQNCNQVSGTRDKGVGKV